jgi:hypothetical protein
MAGAKNYGSSKFDDAASSPTDVLIPGTSNMTVTFAQSQSSTLGTANIYFVLGDANFTVMKMEGVTVNEATLDFDIDGIATISWSGNATNLTDHTANAVVAAAAAKPTSGTGSAVGDVVLVSDDENRLLVTLSASGGSHTAQVYEATTSTTNFIRNRLTILTIAPTSQDPDGDGSNELESSYSLTLTGGSITISNNNTYITPEEIGLVNVPIGHVTGTRNVSGSFTCYLTENTTGANADNSSNDFFTDLRAITNVVTNSFNLVFKVGGATGTGLELAMPTCHVEIPTHSIEDIISLETNFMALPSAITAADELNLTYRP